jgi:hypothetical protein
LPNHRSERRIAGGSPRKQPPPQSPGNNQPCPAFFFMKYLNYMVLEKACLDVFNDIDNNR